MSEINIKSNNMIYIKKQALKKLILPIVLFFILLSCSPSNDLIIQPPNFNPADYLKPNKHGIKNSTEFLKQSEDVIENAPFVPARVEGGIKTLIGNVQFPHNARYQYQEGEVYLNLFIDKTGKVVFVRVLESPDNRLTRYSIYAVQHTDFLPGTLNDKPVKSTRLVMFNFSFKLDNDVTY